MDVYPPEYVLHNLPFIVLSGLGSKEDLEPLRPLQDVLPGRAVNTITCDAPSVSTERREQLLQEFLNYDGTKTPWDGRGLDRRGNTSGFRFRVVGRNFQLPPKKADAPTTSETTPPSSPTIAAATSWVLHSPISPLSPRSAIFPDGVLAPSWVAKHQHYVPSVFISFFDFTTDPITNSLHDNQLKTEINKLKAQFQRSDYRTRFVVVLLSDKTSLESVDIEERLNSIRRGTGLDPKTQLFFMPTTSEVDLRSSVASVLSTLRPLSVEYYRDLTKHARRKKGRGTIPPPTAPPTRGTSQTLAHLGWNIRYDFKLGVFAEFRQEMDAAQRHYNTSLDALFGPEGIFETTASWSPRWDEIRLLADAIALRHIRCQLFNNHPTSAAQTWLKYKTRLKDVLDRRGKGTSTYGWEAWGSTWAQIMAEVIQQTDLNIFRITEPLPQSELLPAVDTNPVYSPPERQFPFGERLPPWELLHHPGYWYKSSADHAKRRYLLARDMPEEDRTPPGMSPATKVSNRNLIYDQYLVPEPHLEFPVQGTPGGFEHWKDIVGKLEAAIAEFEAREQFRKVYQLQLELARTLIHVKRYGEAFEVMRPLWEAMSWRAEGWWSLASEVLWGLHECALRVRRAETYVATEWELLSHVFVGKARYKHDLMACLDNHSQFESSEKCTVSLGMPYVASCHHKRMKSNRTVSAVFTFEKGEGSVGEPLISQIAITSMARQGSAPINLSTLAFHFKGCLSEIRLNHEPDESASGDNSQIFERVLEEHSSSEQKPRWEGQADLTLHPGQTKAYNFPIIFREAGDVEVTASKFDIGTDRFDLKISTDEITAVSPPLWWINSGTKVKSRKLNRDSGIAVKVLPKPPKMEIRLPDMFDHYYTDEPVTLAIEVWNKEEEDTEAVLEVRLLGRSKDTLGYEWIRDASSPLKEVPPPVDDDMDLPGHVVGHLSKDGKTTERIRFTAPAEPADYALEVKVLYHILSERDIPISKTMIADLVFIAPFETSYELTPRVHPDPWPSYFELLEAEAANNAESTDAFGIAQKWQLEARVASFAEEVLEVKDLAVEIHSVHGGATCDILREFDAADEPMQPQEIHEWSFCIDCRKMNLEERRPTALDTSLNILWQRTGNSDNPTVMTSIPIPRIHIPSSEPRVLATATHSTSLPDLIYMDYTLENPTMHFLTFELSMEASEEFGFSGPKLRTLQLLPMSRQTARYNILPLETRAWITPQLRVTDLYFNKTLKVQGTDGLRMDKKGVSVWVPGEDGEGPDESDI